MLLSHDKATERLNSERNLANRFAPKNVTITETSYRGNRKGAPDLSPEVATTVALLTRSGDTSVAVGKLFGISNQRANEIKRGVNSTKVDEELVERKLSSVRDSALEKLTQSLLKMTDDKLDATDAKGLSSIASNMGKVVDSMRGRDIKGEGNRVEIHIYAPETKREELYQTIEV